MKNSINDLDKIQEPIVTATPEVKGIIQQVLKLEKERSHSKISRNMAEEIVKIVKEVISE